VIVLLASVVEELGRAVVIEVVEDVEETVVVLWVVTLVLVVVVTFSSPNSQ